LGYDLVANAPWGELRLITSEKSYFYSEPKTEKKLKSYLVKGDVVGVVKQEGSWLQIEYHSASGKMSRRWINAIETKNIN
jgi:hypothetical protein